MSATELLAQRQTLRLCTAGSVDDGKSTFVGRLLHDTKSVLADQLASVERTSADRGFDGLDLSRFRPDRNAAAGGALPKIHGTTR